MTMIQNDQLPIPDAAKHDPKSFELLRVWIAEEGQHVSLRCGVWDDPAAWGLLLADLARHIVNTYEQTVTLDRPQILQRIKEAFDAELESPTDTPLGR
jgi:hypothetical protein